MNPFLFWTIGKHFFDQVGFLAAVPLMTTEKEKHGFPVRVFEQICGRDLKKTRVFLFIYLFD